MYFHDRAEAGRMLAQKLEKYKSEHIVVVSLGLGSTIVAAQVAMALHANLALYIVRSIKIPGENNPIAGLGSGDTFTFNDYYSTGEIEDLAGEYRAYLEQERMEQSHRLHTLVGDSGELNRSLLRHRIVILVADGMANAFALSVAVDYFKHIAIKQLIIATPVASLQATDQMHILGDGLCCLSVVENYFNTDHYYDVNVRPSPTDVMKIMHNIALNWDHSSVSATVYAKNSQVYDY